MKITISAVFLMGVFSVSHASPHPNNGGLNSAPPSVTPTSSLPAITTIPPAVPSSALPDGSTTSVTAYPSGGYDCVPIVYCYSSVGIATSYAPGGTVSVTLSATPVAPPPATVTTTRPNSIPSSSSAHHENWGKHPPSRSTSVVYPVPVTYPAGACPPGYTPSYGGTPSIQPVGTTSSVPSAPSGTTTSTSAANTVPPSPQNLNGSDDLNKPKGAAGPSYNINIAGTMLGSLFAAVLLV